MKLKLNSLAKGGLVLLAVLLCNFAFAQQKITGTVTDAESGEPLIGANILVEGTSTGTITDLDGTYTLNVPDDATRIVFSYTGYTSETVAIDGRSEINIRLSAGQQLDEVVVVGYGSQKEKEITSAVTSVGADEFNRGPITDPAQLLQGKVAGLQVYNRGGDPNGQSIIRLRGISTVGANTEPLVVVDGIIGASLENVDPNDIENVTVLKDGSAAAIYGSRGSSGVILVTTRSGSQSDGVEFSYSGQTGVSTAFNSVDIMSSDEFLAAGGTNLGVEDGTVWLDEVTRAGINNVHSLSASGGSGNTKYRISGNYRNIDGILKNSGFEQFNARVNLSTKAFNDRLSIDFNSSFTNRNSQFGFNEALRYAVLYNPTAPILAENAPFTFSTTQFGGFFETLGVFDSFNPVSIIEQNRNDGKRTEITYGALLSYDILDNLSISGRVAQQNTSFSSEQYYPTTSLFRGNATSPVRKGRADLYDEITSFQLYEGYATYINSFGKSDLRVTAGYSFQQNNFESTYFQLGDFPDDSKDFSNILETSQDLQNAGFIQANSDESPNERIIAFFGRANMTIDNAIFLNASLRREGSTKLGEDNRWGLFPAFGVGVDLTRYVDLGGVDLLKVRAGYGVTGSLPLQNGLSRQGRQIVNGADGSVSTEITRAANPELKWEEKAETNIGIELSMDRFTATLDVYNRDISDFILERSIDPAENDGIDRRFENAGLLNTQGAELTLGYDVIQKSNVRWNTGLVLSTYRTTLEQYVLPREQRAILGAPGQNNTNLILIREGEEIGQIWGPRFDQVDETGAPTFVDINNDGDIVADQGSALNENADFEVLGNGIPDLEFGWTNQVSIGQWSINAFFRGALGHSLVNTFRAFYEPRIASQSSYNFVNTDLAIPELTIGQFSSLYVESADFFKLDNLTISRSFNFGSDAAIQGLTVSLTGQNLFIITNYTGTDPEPALVDYGSVDNGAAVDFSSPDVLSPGIDRRYNYFASRTITFGLNLNF